MSIDPPFTNDPLEVVNVVEPAIFDLRNLFKNL